MFTVIMASDEYGEERFPRDTMQEAMTTAKSLIVGITARDDGIERIVSLLLDDETIAALLEART